MPPPPASKPPTLRSRTHRPYTTRPIDQQKAGLSPAIDTLRSQVELQTRQQQLIAARNDFAKQKLSLARIIGLPPGQEFFLTEKAPYKALTPLPLEVYLQRAYAARPDYQAAQAQVRAAELSHRAATAGRYPTLDVNANYGDIGVTPAHSNGTWQVDWRPQYPHFCGWKSSQRRSRSRCPVEAGTFSIEMICAAASTMKFAPPCWI